MSPRATRRDCRHPGTPHFHGTRLAYVLDICRCPECREANAAAEQDRRREITYGRWQPYVDADSARRHLRALRKRGIGLRRAAKLSGVPYTTLESLVYGSPAAGTPPTQRVRHETARRILGISLADATPADGARVDATGTRRRIQALVTIGWTINDLASRLGRDTASVRHTLRRDTVNTASAAAVADLYERLWNTPPDESTAARRKAAASARDMARSHGWRPSMAWDDIDTDPEPDPTPQPRTPTPSDEVDELDLDIVTDRITSGKSMSLEPGPVRDEVIRRLTQHGFSLPEIAELLAVTTRTVSRRRRVVRAA